jgi:hypothetical protein
MPRPLPVIHAFARAVVAELSERARPSRSAAWLRPAEDLVEKHAASCLTLTKFAATRIRLRAYEPVT